MINNITHMIHSPPPNNIRSRRWFTKYYNASKTLRFGYVLSGLSPRYISIPVSKSRIVAAMQIELFDE